LQSIFELHYQLVLNFTYCQSDSGKALRVFQNNELRDQ